MTLPSLGQEVLWQENFDEKSLDNWNRKTFTWRKNTIKQEVSGNRSLLRIESDNSAGGIWREEVIDIEKDVFLKWSWKVDQLPPGLDPQRKSGDDYAIRLFVIFEEPKYFGLDQGKQLCYVWSKSPNGEKVYPSPFSESVGMMVVNSGESRLMEWVEVNRNISEDYKSYFGAYPEKIVGFAVMSDTDNSDSEAIGFLDYLRLESH